MSRIFDRTFGATVDHRWATLLLILAVTALALLGYIAPQRLTELFASAPEATVDSEPTSAESFEPTPDVDPVSLSDSDVILVVDSDDFFTAEGASALRAVVESLEELNYVESILWMDEVPVLNIFGLQQPLLPRATASARQFEESRDKALAHPLVHGQLLSTDGRTLLLLIKINWLFVESDEDSTTRLKEVAQQAAAEYPETEFSFLVTGRVPIYLTFMQAHSENLWKYQMIGYGMVGLMAIILFRGIRAVMIVALAPSTGVFWTLGILRFFDFQDNPFNDVLLPVLLSLVGLTDGVHLMVEIRRRRAAGSSEREAARAGVSKVGLACALTSVTTAVGFGSLSLAHHDIVREFGWSCTIGVLLTFLAVITVIPLACSTWLGRNVHLGHEKGLVDRNLGRIGGVVEFVLQRDRLISRIGIGVTVLLILVSMTLRPDERRSAALPTTSETSIALEHMDQAFGGLELSSVDVTWSEEIASDSPDVLRAIAAVDDLLQKEELIGHPLSIRNFIEALPGDGDPAERMTTLELLPPPLKRAFYTPERRAATVSFRVQDLGIATYGPVFERVEAGLDEIAREYPSFTFELTGSAVRRWRNLYQIVIDLITSLGSASVIIFLMLASVYRSIRMGLISIVPNFFPLAVTGTYLVLTGQTLEIVSVCAFTVCLGIAVDDTIHFLTRFEEERKTSGDEDAIRRAFTGTGTALIMTTVVLVVGFATVMFSDMRDQRIFASMGGLTIGAALFGDLVFLPALLSRFAPPRVESQSDGVTE